VELQFEYLPSEKAVFDALVPFYIKGLIYGALVEAYVSEQSARMAAMDEASKNAEEMLGSLQIHYNRVRQASITQEVTEIISGSAALLE
jgi:F-type H+-transporting ATPase subunit gamma